MLSEPYVSSWLTVSRLPEHVAVREVGPRDGFQMEERVPTDAKLRLIELLVETGVHSIEAASFVSKRALPQMDDAEEVWARLPEVGGVRYSALVPNLRGVERALGCGVGELVFVVSASESHNRSNLGRSVAKTLDEIALGVEAARQAGASVRATVATSFGCPFEADVSVDRLLGVVRRLAELRFTSVSLADTIGMATPRQVANVVEVCRSSWPEIEWNLHLHNTRGMGIANVLAGLQCGVREFDSSVGGLGGCPFAPGASGNIATEELVFMLSAMEIHTGVDLAKVLDAAREAERIVGRRLSSQLLHATILRPSLLL